MRSFIAPVVAIAMTASSAFAADATAPLPAGKPAGVHNAELAGDTGLLIIGAAIIAAGIAIAVSNNGGGGPANSTTPVATTSTTATG